MDKKKADIVILGNLICEEKLTGGGKIYSCKREDLGKCFDVGDACVVDGDVCAGSFNAGGLCVVVCGAVAAKGGEG